MRVGAFDRPMFLLMGKICNHCLASRGFLLASRKLRKLKWSSRIANFRYFWCPKSWKNFTSKCSNFFKNLTDLIIISIPLGRWMFHSLLQVHRNLRSRSVRLYYKYHNLRYRRYKPHTFYNAQERIFWYMAYANTSSVQGRRKQGTPLSSLLRTSDTLRPNRNKFDLSPILRIHKLYLDWPSRLLWSYFHWIVANIHFDQCSHIPGTDFYIWTLSEALLELHLLLKR